jgi:hypothetical protein
MRAQVSRFWSVILLVMKRRTWWFGVAALVCVLGAFFAFYLSPSLARTARGCISGDEKSEVACWTNALVTIEKKMASQPRMSYLIISYKLIRRLPIAVMQRRIVLVIRHTMTTLCSRATILLI